MPYHISGEKHDVIYCANYRVASKSTAATIIEMGGVRVGAHHEVPTEPNPECLVVETVRHHCDVIASWWMWRSSSTPFEEFVKLVLDGQHGALKPDKLYGKFPSNYILKYETLDFEWETLCLNAGLEHQPLSRSDSARPKAVKWRTLFPWTLANQVYEVFKDEMEELGYGVS